MKDIYNTFKGGVINLTFRLLPKEGDTPWAINGEATSNPSLLQELVTKVFAESKPEETFDNEPLDDDEDDEEEVDPWDD